MTDYGVSLVKNKYDMIEDKETNFVYISDKLREKQKDAYNRLTTLFNKIGIQYGLLKQTNDYWARDYMPIQVGEDDYLMYDYNPDYLQDEEYVQTITNPQLPCRDLNLNIRKTHLVIDGGNITLCGDYIVMTDKVFTENGKEKYDEGLSIKLKEVLGRDIIFIPWHCENPDDEEEDCYGHSDGFVHWCGGNKVLMTDHWLKDPEEADEIKRRLEDKGFDVVVMKFDVPNPENLWNWAYVNYLQVGDKIIVPTFGIAEDKIALRYIKECNLSCEVYGFRMRDVAIYGGALHCITWNIKR